jgi:4-hydroxybutyryl-CoA dehydratase/vinylacetyl-CoA-Delta-isomerase
MVFLSQSLMAASLACSHEGAPLPCGAYYVDPMLANVTKHAVTRNYYEICRLAQDLAGGFIATLPSEADFDHPQFGEKLRKYYSTSPDQPTENRVRLGRLVENMTAGIGPVECMHGAGSPQAQRVMMLRQAKLPQKVKMAESLAGIVRQDPDEKSAEK